MFRLRHLMALLALAAGLLYAAPAPAQTSLCAMTNNGQAPYPTFWPNNIFDKRGQFFESQPLLGVKIVVIIRNSSTSRTSRDASQREH